MLSNESPTEVETKPKENGLDWQTLRAKSLQEGGFGEDRIDIWPKLLDVSRQKVQEDAPSLAFEDEKPHQDERQIGLDTDRSFVLYPVEPKMKREDLQAGLHELLVSLFRKRPRLNYFQGYHDVVTVFYLTLPEELQLPCVEKISLHRLRDSMGQGLEPVLGLLRVTKNLLRLADPDYAKTLEQTSPLHFYALSNLLTLFSHDMPTLPLIQHVFDYLLSRPPIASVYLATAIILSRKQDVKRLEEEEEEGMIHSLLSSLPGLIDGPLHMKISDESLPLKEEESLEESDNTFFKMNDEPDVLDHSSKAEDIETKLDMQGDLKDISNPAEALELPDTVKKDASAFDPEETSPQSTNPPSSNVDEDSAKEDNQDSALLSSMESEISTEKDITPVVNPLKVEDSDVTQATLSADPKRSQLLLTELLKQADELYEKFPPSHSGLALSSIMGPQSVVFTWSESPSALPSDNMAEAMISHPELVVYPYVEPDAEQKDEASDHKGGKEGRNPRRKRRKLRKSPFGQVEKKTMLAGTVLVLGVAMAVYGIRARNPAGGHAWIHGIVEGHGHANSRDWKRVGGWVGGALAGISQRIINGLSSGSRGT